MPQPENMDHNDDGEGGDEDFSDHLTLFHVSGSQEDHLSRCPHASVPYNSGVDDDSSESDDYIIVESTEIMMLSPPESMDSGDNSTTDDVFQTPPEYSTILSSEEQHPPVGIGNREHDRSDEGAGDGRGETGVFDVGCENDADSNLGFSEIESGVESDLEFSEIELIQMVHVQLNAGRSLRNVPVSELLEFQVSEEGLHGSPLKNSKVPEQNSAESTNPLASAKRKLDFQLEIEANESKTNEGVVLKHVSTGDMRETVDEHQLCRGRVLPSSILGNAETENENAANRVGSGGVEGHRKFTILNYLKTLQNVSNESVPTGSFVGICNRQGVTFPRPRWWPEQGFKVDDDDHEFCDFEGKEMREEPLNWW